MRGQHRTRSPDAICAQIAKRQFGVISRLQAQAAGMSTDMLYRRLADGRWELLYRSTYRITGVPPSQPQEAMAACLRVGRDSFVVGRTAAAAWGLQGGRWKPPEVATPRRIAASRHQIAVRSSTTHSRLDVTHLGALPITTPTRSLIDLAGGVDERTLELALDQSLRSGRVTLPTLASRVAELKASRLPGLHNLRSLINDRDPACALRPTELQTLLRRWLVAWEFPNPVFQFGVTLPDYGRSRLDFAYPDLLVGLEGDSYEWHSGRDAFERDRARISEYASLGWIIIQTTHREIEHHPDRPARRLRSALAQRLST
jgi:hypothetical protein